MERSLQVVREDVDRGPTTRVTSFASDAIDRAAGPRPAVVEPENQDTLSNPHEGRLRVLLLGLLVMALSAISWGLVGLAWHTGQPTLAAVLTAAAIFELGALPHLVTCVVPRWQRK